MSIVYPQRFVSESDLQIDLMAEPDKARFPVPQEQLENLAKFSRWLFGTQEIQPIVTDTRMVSDFGKILNSDEAVQYLERTTTPKFEVALRIAGGDEDEIIRLVQQAADNLELALSRAHFFKDSNELQKEVRRVGINALQLMNVFFTSLRDKIDDLIEGF